MTRITNFGRKKTYLKAGFGNNVDADGNNETQGQSQTTPTSNSDTTKRPRKRRKKVAGSGEDTAHGEEGDHEESTGPVHEERKAFVKDYKKAKSGMKKEKMHKMHDRAALSEKRRLNRIAERNADITCLRCRQKGHTVKGCPNARDPSALQEDGGGEQKLDTSKLKFAPGVGICYRCGSRRHNLSRCKKPVDPEKPLPFASCFVCSKTGHLASTCPQNQGKGVYPNGGSCMLCKQTDHLAKDCPLKSKEMASKDTGMLGDARTEGGADEDFFHVIKRRRDVVQKEETNLKKVKVNISKSKVVQFNK